MDLAVLPGFDRSADESQYQLFDPFGSIPRSSFARRRFVDPVEIKQWTWRQAKNSIIYFSVETLPTEAPRF